MFRKILFPLLLGVSGVAVLAWLGFWQVDRLAWKQDILTRLDARLAAAPVALIPADVTQDDDAYRPVTVTGRSLGPQLHVLVSGTAAGTGYRAITAFETDAGQTILLDQGLLALDAKDLPPEPWQGVVTGTLIWPDDQNSSTPEPDLDANIWFARNVDSMAAHLGTLPLMVVANATPDVRLTALPIVSANIKNDHLEYAITWFLLAAVWAAMTGYLILRTLRQKDA